MVSEAPGDIRPPYKPGSIAYAAVGPQPPPRGGDPIGLASAAALHGFSIAKPLANLPGALNLHRGLMG
jgi:hypothetical protein